MQPRSAVVRTFVAAALGLGTWTAGLAPAVADPQLPVDPAVPVPAPADPVAPPPVDAVAAGPPETLLGQFAQVAQSNPIASMQQLLAASPQAPLLGAAPSTPGSSALTDAYSMAQGLSPQNFRMPTADQVSPYALAPNDNPSPFARIDAWKGVHALVHGGLGRMPGDELGQPLPGTAAAPGSNLPPGLEQFYIDPAAMPPPADAGPPDPLLLPVTEPNQAP